MKKVAIYGGGIGGMSAAHELAVRGYEVHLFEASRELGGKASSQYVKLAGEELPGEHGFRFFPAFYRHLDDTMARIPGADGGTVLDELVSSEEFAIARSGAAVATFPRRIKRVGESLAGFFEVVNAWFDRDGLDLDVSDLGNLLKAVGRFLTSSDARRQAQIEHQSWFEYAGAAQRSERYQALTTSLPRTMVAMDGKNGSAYTIGKVAIQLFILDAVRGVGKVDRVLNGPTTERWLVPWARELERRGVHVHHGLPLTGLAVRDGRVQHGEVGADRSRVDADFHICALPLEKMQRLAHANAALREAPDLEKLSAQLTDATAWMVGAQYFLDRELDIASGHVIYTDSEWAVSSISQGQFWAHSRSGKHMGGRGAGIASDILSVDISDWDTASALVGKPASRCRPSEILDEVFRQVVTGLNHGSTTHVTKANVIGAHLDENVHWDEAAQQMKNDTPLLIHRPGHWHLRPDAKTDIENLYLASDYVKGHTNLATMEGANEAARRSVRYIMAETGDDQPAPDLYELEEPAILAPLRRLDEICFRFRNKDHVFDLADDDRLEVVRQYCREDDVAPASLRDSLGDKTLFDNSRGPVESPEIADLLRTLDALEKAPA